MLDDLETILNDDSLFEDFEVDDRIFSTERYSRTIKAASTLATRKRVQTGFELYRQLFQSVQADIANGRRQIRPISQVEISQKSPIKQGNFYIDNGLLLYVHKIYHPETLEEVQESANRKWKVHTIYENGTENHIWLLSLVSSLYDKKRSGRLVTERIDAISVLGEEASDYLTTGYIYVVRYAGEDRRFCEIDNLYKIGVATDIRKRLSNSHNEATYLFAPVQLVASFEVQNMSAAKLEKYVHDSFQNRRVQLETLSPTGKRISVNEWFIVPLEEIEETINRVVVGLQ